LGLQIYSIGFWTVNLYGIERFNDSSFILYFLKSHQKIQIKVNRCLKIAQEHIYTDCQVKIAQEQSLLTARGILPKNTSLLTAREDCPRTNLY